MKKNSWKYIKQHLIIIARHNINIYGHSPSSTDTNKFYGKFLQVFII